MNSQSITHFQPASPHSVSPTNHQSTPSTFTYTYNQPQTTTSPSTSSSSPPPQATFKDLPEFFETTLGEVLALRADQLNQFKLGPPDLCHVVKVHTKTNALVSSYHYVLGQSATSPGDLATYLHHLLQRPFTSNTPTASTSTGTSTGGTGTTTMAATTTTSTSSSLSGSHGSSSTSTPSTLSSSTLTSTSLASPTPFPTLHSNMYKITSAMYCCYHPTYQMDVRVEVHYPGTVECHGINAKMKKVPLDPNATEFWSTLNMATFLRTLDPSLRTIPGTYRFRSSLPTSSHPLVGWIQQWSKSTVHQWIELFMHSPPLSSSSPSSSSSSSSSTSSHEQEEKEKEKKTELPTTRVAGWCKLGPDPWVPSPTFGHHKGIFILLKVIGEDLGRWDLVQHFFTVLAQWKGPTCLHETQETETEKEKEKKKTEPSSSSLDVHGLSPQVEEKNENSWVGYAEEDALGLLASAYLAEDMDSVAAKVLYQGLKMYPNSVCLLTTQVDFLLKKKKVDTALKVATRLVGMNPLDFSAWHRLIQVYLMQKDWAHVLLAMNVCPMFSVQLKESMSIPVTTVTWFPKPLDPDYVEPFTCTTPPWEPQGPFPWMYTLLTHMIQAIGWEQTLQCRAKVFVMEHEPYSSSKRLCERWLDDVFICLYQDLSAHAMYKDHPQLKRSAMEWEQLGDLTVRLNLAKEALPMYLACLATVHASRSSLGLIQVDILGRKLAFVPRVLLKLIQCCVLTKEVAIGIRVVMKLLEHPQFYTSILEGVYGEVLFPNPVTEAMFKFIQIAGLSFLQTELLQLKPPTMIYKRITAMLEYAEQLQVKGYDR
ncbi:hypothetical protein HMI54_011918 [Coelomomyces lativittatus]|nr:hypothetical protein HMI56_003661 [Coelomomyces lativittatus]KAJ1515655.1 hypothetical protein HMI54_011918 [Coelomomyces lativittatus]KAJ1516908.1 hypothetical protein HMI55_001098 [Coelomomyces lativittatus]